LLAQAAHRAGRVVTLCVRSEVTRLEIAVDGRFEAVPVEIVADPESQGPAEWILLATKAQDTPGAAPWLKRLIGPGSKVVILQNGIEHRERVRPYSADAQLLPALVYAAIERVAPGRIIHHQGDLIAVPDSPLGAAFADLLKGGGLTIRLENDFTTAAWRKLLGNIAGNPLTALTLRRVEVLRDPGIRRLAIGLLDEAVAVAQSEGAALTQEDAQMALDVYGTYKDSIGSSMLYDRLAGLPLEHDHLTGALVRRADRRGVPVPLNKAILALLDALSAPHPL
jgi:2-dehydropantoate 2-reductase